MEDPGWRRAVPMAIPMYPGRYTRVASMSALEQLRALWLSCFTVAALVVGISVALGSDAAPDDVAVGAVVAVGIVSLAAIFVVRARAGLDTTSLAALGRTYRTRFLLGLGCAEAALLVGFVLSLVEESFWLTLIGAAFAAAGFLAVAPTRRDLDRQQWRISQRGSALSLLESVSPPPSDRR